MKPSFPASDEELKAFNPNNDALWATYVPDRYSQRFKVHSSRKMALNAFTGQTCAALWEFSGGEWVKRAEKFSEERPQSCSNCGASTMVPNTYYGKTQMWNEGGYKFKKNGSRVTDALELMFLCSLCQRMFP